MERATILTLKDVDGTTEPSSGQQWHLKNINLHIDAGEVIAIVGRSDSGRNALLRCISLLDPPKTGIVAIDEKDLTILSATDLLIARRQVGYISHSPVFVTNKNVAHNIAIPLQIQGITATEVQERVNTVLGVVGLQQQSSCYPEDLTPLQAILLDLARQLINKPKVLLCEDIFVRLDVKAQEKLTTLLHTLNQQFNLTMLIATNEAEIIKTLCNKVLIMHQGTVVENVSSYDFFARPNSEVAKDFIKFSCKHELPSTIKRKMVVQEQPDHHAVVRINFIECLNPEEILANIIDAYTLKMNIIQAYQEQIGIKTLNIMILEIYGESKLLHEALKFLNINGLNSEIIGYVPDNS